MEVDESQEEGLIGETVNYVEDCDTEMSEEIMPGVAESSRRTRTTSATYTFPDPEQPSRNLVLEFPVPKIADPVAAVGKTDVNSGREKSGEEVPKFPSDMNITGQTDTESIATVSESASQDMEISDSQSTNQAIDTVEEHSSFSSSPWFSYMEQRTMQSSYPPQHAFLARQHALFRTLSDDHAYGQHQEAIPGEAKPASLFIRSKKTLFFGNNGFNTVAGGDWTVDNDPENVVIDVVTDPNEERMDESQPPYNRAKAFAAMNEVEKFMLQMRGPMEELLGSKDGKVDEDPLVKTYTKRGTWTSRQRNLFDAAVKILQTERHVRLASMVDEPIIRRLSLDKAAARFRRLMAGVEWNGRLVYWLHATLSEGLNYQMLAIYIEILQTLKPKIPELVNSLMNYLVPPATAPGGNADGLLSLMDTPWDPIGKSIYRFDKASIKLPKNPIIVVAPHPYAQGQENLAHSRVDCIVKFLTRLGTVVQVDGGSSDELTPSDLYKSMLVTTRDTLVEFRKIHPDRPLVLIGLGIGSMVACQASLLEPCAAIVCFGFPLKTPRGIHGDYGDPLLKLDAAVQFILGMDAGNCPHAEFHDFWEKLNCDTEVVWSAGCDDYLRMGSSAKMSLKMTQSMVDRCFLETMIQFLQQALLKERIRRVEPILPEISKKRKAKEKSATPAKTPSKKAKNWQQQSPEIGDKYSKRCDLLLSESTTSSQEMSNGGGSQSSSDTIPGELPVSSEPEEIPNSAAVEGILMPGSIPLHPVESCQDTPALSESATPPSSAIPTAGMNNEHSTLSIHFTTTTMQDTRRWPDVVESQRRYYENTNRTLWSSTISSSSSSNLPSTGSVPGRPATPARLSVIAHTNTPPRLPSGPSSPQQLRPASPLPPAVLDATTSFLPTSTSNFQRGFSH
ncbi:KAT8 regulatory NSL complex subunit 3 [Hypsibius exemplaris]|uniref:KAT8 regulatory NSL complex subunit 3 n=1 Tax=Hypsibius exemplaris TaxID=2072580 RepID=A0A1W0XF71_HYPEX|nr:KAT8 regulatory NSL complex subunit 3 [Hypsibius exemplaris]